ncbi:MAG: carbonic anhydrase [Oscillospiraceae bacterium]|jgi:carbonic anhydrase|nr:carbonic anhydrase [Oscillospiraceae bacterium]
MNPTDALNRLIAGNRDVTEPSIETLRHFAQNGQHPYAVVITCSDSRVVPERVFGCDIGEIFVVRTAGNVVGEFERGTVEYGTSHLGARLVVVLGHTHCGAVAAALEHHESETPQSLAALVHEVAHGICDSRNAREAERLNVENSVARLRESAALRAAEVSGDIEIKRAIYDIETREVAFW